MEGLMSRISDRVPDASPPDLHRPQTVLILGSRGFIGQHMHTFLAKQGNSVVALHSALLDLRDPEAVTAFFDSHDRFDLVVHCCAVGRSRLVQDAPEVLQDNLKMLDTVLDQREKYGRLVYFSSGAAVTAKGSPYGFSKHLADVMLRQEPGAFNFRVFGCFGPSEPKSRFITTCLLQKCATIFCL